LERERSAAGARIVAPTRPACPARQHRLVLQPQGLNDTTVGRSPKEVLRTAQALQSDGLCAADWKNGEKFVG